MKKTLSLFGLLLVSGFAVAQVTTPPSGISMSENYVFSRTYLRPTSVSSDTVKQIQSVTYFDGLSRPKQSVAIKASPTGKDIVTPIVYDEFGRQRLDYLPIPQSGTTNGQIYKQTQQTNPNTPIPYPVTDPGNVYKGEKIYSEKKLENSPLDRIQEQIQVGQDWSANPVTFDYKTNDSLEVKRYITITKWVDNATESQLKIDSTTSADNGFFKRNQLYKNIVKDEDGNESVEFKNGNGQTILVRKVLSATENADTYYVYNEFDQLSFVISPLAAKSFKNQLTGEVDSAKINNLCYQYRYDGKNRLVEKKLPGKGWEYMVYDNQDRLVMTQDANLGTANKWLFTKYDQFGRVAYTGIYTSAQAYGGAGRNTEQGQVNGKGSNNVARTTGGSGYGSGVILYYDNLPANNYPNSITELLSINYYDTYPPTSPAVPVTILTQAVLQQNSQTSNINTKNFRTASFVKNLDNFAWTKNYIWYDTKGRTIGVNSVNHLNGYTNTRSMLDFSGAVQEAYTYHKRTSVSTEVIIKETFAYDQQNRLVKHDHKINSNPPEILAENTYNEIGQLKTKKVGNNIQEIDYAYNIRGWMTGINLDEVGDFQTGKLFNYKIGYNEPLGTLSTKPYIADQSLEIKEKYNGNIATVSWKYNDVPNTPVKKYGYVYDQLNRLRAGFYYENTGSGFLFTEEHNELQKYDLNGNIDELQRFSYVTLTAPHKIDDLKYYYSGNKVTSITDDGDSNGYEGGGQTISYDANGNMIDMLDKGIKGIAYNYLNLPNQMEIEQGGISTTNIKTLYKADGTKLKKVNSTDTVGINGIITITYTTDYLDGFQYLESTKSTSSNNSAEISELEVAMEREAFTTEEFIVAAAAPPGGGGTDNSVLQFVPTAEGFYDLIENKYIYQYKDHLGNTRLSFAKNQTTQSVEVLDKNDYYPFGMNHLDPYGGSYFGQSSFKNYKYNGKELQETGMYDYGARMYMPDIGRWGVVDPLAEVNRAWSPYRYAYDNPLRFIDPDGRLEDWFWNQQNERVEWRDSSAETIVESNGAILNNVGKDSSEVMASFGIKKSGSTSGIDSSLNISAEEGEGSSLKFSDKGVTLQKNGKGGALVPMGQIDGIYNINYENNLSLAFDGDTMYIDAIDTTINSSYSYNSQADVVKSDSGFYTETTQINKYVGEGNTTSTGSISHQPSFNTSYGSNFFPLNFKPTTISTGFTSFIGGSTTAKVTMSGTNTTDSAFKLTKYLNFNK